MSNIPVQTLENGAGSPVDVSVEEAEKERKTVSLNAVSADFLESAIRVKMNNGMYRYFSYSDFLLAVKDMIDPESTNDAQKKNLKLPVGVFCIEYDRQSVNLSCFYPEGVRDITFRDQAVPRVHPNMIVSIFMSSKNRKEGEYEVTDFRFFGTPHPLSKLERKIYSQESRANGIYTLPFSNMYENGKMCTGSNHLPKVMTKGDLRPLNLYADMVFNSPFNTDLGVRAAKRDGIYRNDATEWFKLLARRAKDPDPKFPYEELE